MEGSLVAYKVFTNGSVLQASEINDNLMRQSVMVFSNAAARTAAITSPVEGMLTWLEDSNRYESFDGAAWVSPFGMVPLANSTFAGVGTVSFSNIFSSQFANYKAFITAVPASGTATLHIRYRDAGGDVLAANYVRQSFVADSTTLQGQRVTTTLADVGVLTAGTNSAIELTLYNPNVASSTAGFANCMSNINGGYLYTSATNYTASTAFTGISFLSSAAAITGNIRIYGIRNS
jgi:hypothetical protein